MSCSSPWWCNHWWVVPGPGPRWALSPWPACAAGWRASCPPSRSRPSLGPAADRMLPPTQTSTFLFGPFGSPEASFQVMEYRYQSYNQNIILHRDAARKLFFYRSFVVLRKYGVPFARTLNSLILEIHLPLSAQWFPRPYCIAHVNTATFLEASYGISCK